jgi:hypothetical protein
MAEANQSPLNFDIRDPHFARDMLEWSRQNVSDMRRTIMATLEMIAASKALMAKADRIIAGR